MFGVPLPDSVQQSLDRICQVRKQPQPDDIIRSMLASLSEQEALFVLEKIGRSKTEIKTLNGYIAWMINRLKTESSSSCSSPTTLLMPNSPPAASSSSVYQTRLSSGASSSSVTSPDRSLGKTVPYGSPVLEQHQDYNRQPHYSSYRSHSGFQPQGESSNPSPATLCNEQSPSSSLSPYQILSALSEIYRRLCQWFQGISSSPFQTSSSSPVTPVQLHKSFQDHGSAHLKALEELEFRRRFMILSYAGRMKLKDVIEEEDIRGWKNLPMVEFENKVWHVLGENNVSKADRRMFTDWDSQRTHYYHCYVSMDGSYQFKGPYLDKTRTLLHKKFGDDNILEIKFTQGEGSSTVFDKKCTYSKLIREGIFVGLKRYSLFVFNVGGNRGKNQLKDRSSSPVKCYFVHESCYMLSGKTMREGRSLFMHVDTAPSLATYMARLSLILSKTVTLEVDWSLVKVEFIEEVYCHDESGNRIYVDGKARIHTDGTGFISEDLALRCPEIIRKGEEINNGHIEDELEDNILEWKQPGIGTRELPLLMQFRLVYKGYAVKGTFVVNKQLPPKTMQIRPSMVKVTKDPKLSDPQMMNSLEIVATSKVTKRTYLSRNLIALLYHGGVPKEYFIKLLEKALEETRDILSNTRTAIRVALRYGEMDDNSNVARMISCGIPLEEPYVQYRLSTLMKMERTRLKKGKICIPDSYYLMGTADPTGILERDEVCIILKDGQLSGNVLVYRNPGIHFGDVHVLKAKYVKELESFVGNAKYSIFFSCKGPRSVADEMGGGDFDGDLYWISRNPQLLESFKPSDPWIRNSSTQKAHGKIKIPSELSNDDLEDELIKLLLESTCEPSFAMAEAAQNWMALMDQYLTLGDSSIVEKNKLKAKILQLVDIYYESLDAPKNGYKVSVPKELKVRKFPHFMGKNPSYLSSSILGLIYDTVGEYETVDRSLKEIQKLPLFEVDIPKNCLICWEEKYRDYRVKMTAAMGYEDKESKNQAANMVIREYKKILYGAEEFEQSERNKQQIYNDALAIYHICYDYANTLRTETGAVDVGKCGFAWKVAGAALCQLHDEGSLKPGQKVFRVLPSILKDIL